MEDMLKGSLPGDNSGDQTTASTVRGVENQVVENKNSGFTAMILSIFIIALAILFAVLYFADESVFKDDTFLRIPVDHTAFTVFRDKIG